jgi:uncharacterized BrkB/YihY/UPF0761 family membrane protein
VVMLWLWFSAMALLAGAHLTAVVDGVRRTSGRGRR